MEKRLTRPRSRWPGNHDKYLAKAASKLVTGVVMTLSLLDGALQINRRLTEAMAWIKTWHCLAWLSPAQRNISAAVTQGKCEPLLDDELLHFIGPPLAPLRLIEMGCLPDAPTLRFKGRSVPRSFLNSATVQERKSYCSQKWLGYVKAAARLRDFRRQARFARAIACQTMTGRR
jgi:hypothetical protein